MPDEKNREIGRHIIGAGLPERGFTNRAVRENAQVPLENLAGAAAWATTRQSATESGKKRHLLPSRKRDRGTLGHPAGRGGIGHERVLLLRAALGTQAHGCCILQRNILRALAGGGKSFLPAGARDYGTPALLMCNPAGFGVRIHVPAGARRDVPPASSGDALQNPIRLPP
jgi:hypothetical protein